MDLSSSLAALVAPSILAPEGRIVLPGWDLIGYLLGAIVAATTRRMVVALAFGLGGLLLLALLRLQ